MEIHGGTLVATGGEQAPGIGTTNYAGFKLDVDGGVVYARGGAYGAGIGSAGEYVCYDESNLTFSGGKVVAVGGKNMASIGCKDGAFGTYYGGNKLTFSGGIVECDKCHYEFEHGWKGVIDCPKCGHEIPVASWLLAAMFVLYFFYAAL